MQTFLLISGAWLGSWCWQEVANILEQKGATVMTLTLSDLHKKASASQPSTTTLETHIDDVVSLIESNNLQDITLVGHSYSGMVITGVADRVAPRIGHLLYLDAVLPKNGEAFVAGWSANGQAAVRAEAADSGDPTRWPLPSDVGVMAVMADFSEAQLKTFHQKAVPHPIETLFQQLHLHNQLAVSKLRKSYVVCTLDRPQLPAFLDDLHAASDWQVVEMATGHWPMITAPLLLADKLIEIATP